MNQIKNSIHLILKKVKQAKLIRSKFFLPVYLAAILFAGLLRFYTFFSAFRKEQIEENAQSSLIGSLFNVGSGNVLEILLIILEFGCLIMVIASLVYLVFYLVVAVRREFLLNEKELSIKSMLGVQPTILSLEFFGESAIVGLIAIVTGTLTANFIYVLVRNSVASWIIEFFITPIDFMLSYDLLYVLAFLILEGLLFLWTNMHMRKKYYREIDVKN